MSGKSDDAPTGPQPEGSRPSSHEFQLSHVGARVPEKVGRGVFSTGVLVLQGPSEFVLDFVLRMNQPQQVAARVVMPFTLIPQFIDALRTNLDNYRNTFGAPPAMPPMPPPPAKPPSIDEIYQDLKINDDVMVGAYANAVMIVHTATDFCLEFVSNYYPKAVITSRVFL